MADPRFVAYYRVSTARQGQSGLGLEAQRQAVHRYASGAGGRLLAEFTEIESGKNNARPELARAIRQAKVTGGRLIIAKMDRLSRNAAFLLHLRDSGVRFVAADLPNADETVVGIMAVIAQREREMISLRTREALQVARRRLAEQGQRLGNPNGAAALRRAGRGNAAAVDAVQVAAAARAHDLAEIVADVVAAGFTTCRAIAGELNRREIATPRGRQWHASTVADLQRRLGTSGPADSRTNPTLAR